MIALRNQTAWLPHPPIGQPVVHLAWQPVATGLTPHRTEAVAQAFEQLARASNAGQQRLVPIFLTTATTVGGLLSLTLAGGPLWVGMSWLMIFGLLVATLLTLLAIPAAYAIVLESRLVQRIQTPGRLGEASES